MKTVKETEYVYCCDPCAAWYDTDEAMETCPKCERQLRLLDKEEKDEFYCKIARSGYNVVPKK